MLAVKGEAVRLEERQWLWKWGTRIGVAALLLSPFVIYIRRAAARATDEEITEDDYNADAEHSKRVLASLKTQPLRLLKEQNPTLAWSAFVEDAARRSYAYLLRREARQKAPALA